MSFHEVPFGERHFLHWTEASGNWHSCESTEDVQRLMHFYNGVENCALSICAFIEENPILLYVPFDFDSETIHVARDEAATLFQFLVNADYDVALHFSGCRGYHVIISVVPKVYTSEQLCACQEYFTDLFGLTTVDHQLFGDMMRRIRIPDTVNMKSKMPCMVVAHHNGKLLDLDEMFPDNGYGAVDVSFSDVAYAMDGDASTTKQQYPCLEKLICDRDYWIENHPRHSYEPSDFVRWSFICYRMWQGIKQEDVFNECKSFGWDDWDDSTTAYRIGQIYAKRYFPPSCDTIKRNGYCTGCARDEWSMEAMLNNDVA